MSGEVGALGRRNSDDKRMAPRKRKEGTGHFGPCPLGCQIDFRLLVLAGTSPSSRLSPKYGRYAWAPLSKSDTYPKPRQPVKSVLT